MKRKIELTVALIALVLAIFVITVHVMQDDFSYLYSCKSFKTRISRIDGFGSTYKVEYSYCNGILWNVVPKYEGDVYRYNRGNPPAMHVMWGSSPEDLVLFASTVTKTGMEEWCKAQRDSLAEAIVAHETYMKTLTYENGCN